MNRREFLECTALLISGTALTNAPFALSEEQFQYLASAPDYACAKADYFTPAQRRIVAAIAETIIPETETPGAIRAGVPHFIELMVSDWLNDREREIFSAGLQDIEVRIPEEYGAPFDQLPAEQQIAVLDSLEESAADSPWFTPGNVRRAFISDAPFICQIKELTTWGFFSSKVGSTQVLHYEVMPMRFDGDVPRKPDDSDWQTFRF